VSQIQKEIKQSKPFRSPSHEATVALLVTADVVRRHLAHAIEPWGLTVQQYNVMRILRGAGPEGLPTLEIADRMIEKAPGITRLLDRLEAKGLVRRERCPKDRRQVLCFSTAASLDLLDRLDHLVDQIDRDAIGKLQKRDITELIRILDNVRARR